MAYKSGDSYEGEWHEGRRQGQGVEKRRNGDVFKVRLRYIIETHTHT